MVSMAMRGRRWIAFLLIVAPSLCCCQSHESHESPPPPSSHTPIPIPTRVRVDSTMLVLGDLTFDGRPDTIRIHVEGESIDEPFRWTLEVRDRGDVLFRHEADDAWFDEYFGNPGFGAGLGSRDLEKLEYYFSWMPQHVIQELRWGESFTVWETKDQPHGLFDTTRMELRESGVRDESRISSILETIEGKLKAGTMVLTVPINPAMGGFPRIFVPEIRKFILIYIP